MGMFNYITCEMSLPDGETGTFQTKSLGERLLDNYRITENGQIQKQEKDLQYTDKWFDWKETKNGLRKVYCSAPVDPKPEDWGPWQEWEYVNHRWVDFPFTGEFGFHIFKKDDTWHEYVAEAKDGKVLSIRERPKYGLDTR
jgi:hypothetical protein